MKPKFNLRLRTAHRQGKAKPRNQAEATIKYVIEQDRGEKMSDSVEWSKFYWKHGYLALLTRKFMLIKSKTMVKKWFDRKVVVGDEKQHLRMLIPDEEQIIAQYTRNKNCVYLRIGRRKQVKFIINEYTKNPKQFQ